MAHIGLLRKDKINYEMWFCFIFLSFWCRFDMTDICFLFAVHRIDSFGMRKKIREKVACRHTEAEPSQTKEMFIKIAIVFNVD